MSLWKLDSSLVPEDPNGRLRLFEIQSGAIDSLLKSGAIMEFGFFETDKGYVIFEASSRAEAMRLGTLFYPNVRNEPYEMIPWEEGKRAIRGAYEAQIKAMG